jgi:TolB-like protein
MSYSRGTISRVCGMVLATAACVASAQSTPRDIPSLLAGLCDRLFTSASLKPGATVAVMPFESRSEQGAKSAHAVSEYLVSLLCGRPGIALVDRMDFSKAMQELALSQSGVVDESTQLQVGRTLAANYLVCGSVGDAIGQLVVHARLIDTEQGTVLASVSQPLPASDILSFAREALGEKNSVSSSLFRSAVVPGWGQMYAGYRLRGILSLGAFVAAAGASGAVWSVAASRAGDYDDFVAQTRSVAGEQELIEDCFGTGITRTSPEFDQALFNDYKQTREQSLWSDYQSSRTAGAVMLAVTGAVWATNLIDATIAGNQARKRVQLYFSLAPKRSRGESRVGVVVHLPRQSRGGTP